MPYTRAEAIRQRMDATFSANNLLPTSLVLQTRYHAGHDDFRSDHASVMPSDLAFDEATLYERADFDRT